MKFEEMFDPNILMMHGLIDHPVIIDLENKRLANNQKLIEIKDMVERLMGANEDLDDLLVAITLMQEKEGV